MLVLGLSAGFHDSAAAVVADGALLAAVEQERLTRTKHDASFPDRAMDVALAAAGVAPGDVDLVVHHERPVSVVDRHVATRLRTGPAALRSLFVDVPVVLREQLGAGHRIARWFADRAVTVPPVEWCEHHLAHAAAAFLPSPFPAASVLTVDGVGEWATTSAGHGRGGEVVLDAHIDFPHSLGLLYSAVTEYCGFRPNGGEGELMGLAPFGEPRFRDLLWDRVLTVAEDGSFRLDLRYFAFLRGRRMTSRRFHDLIGGPPRQRGAEPDQRTADLAASVQSVLEEVLTLMVGSMVRRSGERRLCLAGGVALNCVANGRLAADTSIDEVWVQPAAGDAGAAVGAALWAASRAGAPRVADGDGMSGTFLGPAFDDVEVESWLRRARVPHRVERDRSRLCAEVAERLERGAVVGWFQGRMEFGPRALGHRSILADARSGTVQRRLNRLVKERADFRPFAPAVLASRAGEYFDGTGDWPYMTFVAPVTESRRSDPGPSAATLADRVAQVRSELPAVTHVDHSARVQTVDAARNPEFHALLVAFERRTGCPVLLNTSFNARDEPIVCTPEDALATFRRTGLDLLVLGSCLVEAAA